MTTGPRMTADLERGADRRDVGRGSVSIGFKTSPQGVDWPTLDATWARAGELGVFDSAWMNDHLTDPARDRGGPSWEALTRDGGARPPRARACGRPCRPVQHVPPPGAPGEGRDAPRPRRPAAGSSLGLGAGWHEGEHLAVRDPAAADAGAVRPLRIGRPRHQGPVLGRGRDADRASRRPDPFYPLDGATNEPPPRHARAARRSGSAARSGAASRSSRRDRRRLDAARRPRRRHRLLLARSATRILGAMEAAGRDPAGFAFTAQVPAGTTRRVAAGGRSTARIAFVRAGATHVILGHAGPARAGWPRRRRPRGGDPAPRGHRPMTDERPDRTGRRAPRTDRRPRHCRRIPAAYDSERNALAARQRPRGPVHRRRPRPGSRGRPARGAPLRPHPPRMVDRDRARRVRARDHRERSSGRWRD